MIQRFPSFIIAVNTQASALTDLESRDFITATALPKIQDAEAYFDHDPNVLSAYRVCLQFEANAVENAKPGAASKSTSKSEATGQIIDPEKATINARILGYLLYLAPSHLVLAEVVRSIHSCNTEGYEYERLYDLGETFFNSFIRAFRKYKGRTPNTSDHPSRSSFDRHRETILANLEEAPKDHKEAEERALLRDGYWCPITGRYDLLALQFKIADRHEVRAAGGAHALECAHIFPESIDFNVEGPGNEAKAEYASSVLAVLHRFGYDTTRIKGGKVHSLFNVITMEKNAHDFFDNLALWLEETDIPNQYHPKSFTIGFIVPDVVTFKSPDPERLPVPSSELIALHAACSKVPRLSGAAEYLDEFDRDMDGLDVLASDGTSSAVLHHAIWESLGKSIDDGT